MTDALRRGRLYAAHLDKLRPVLAISPDVRNELASDDRCGAPALRSGSRSDVVASARCVAGGQLCS